MLCSASTYAATHHVRPLPRHHDLRAVLVEQLLLPMLVLAEPLAIRPRLVNAGWAALVAAAAAMVVVVVWAVVVVMVEK